jgi:hypothetical protein
MADERIEVEWIASAARMVQILDKLDTRLDKQDQKLDKIAKTSEAAAEAAAGSFNQMEQELKQAEIAMNKLTIGTAEFAAQKAKVDSLRQSLTQAKASLKAAPTQLSQALSGGMQKLTSFAAGFVGLQQTITAIVNELGRAKQLRIGAAETTRSFEQSIAAMALNIGAANVPAARQMILEQAPQLGVTPEGLAELIGAGISGGAKDLDEALSLSAKVLKLTAGDVQTAQPIMSGMLSLAGATGQRDFEAAIGQLSQFQAAARGEDLAMSINNLSTSLAAANLPGERIAALGAERSLEIASVLSQVLQDPRMDKTGTAVRNLFLRMDAFVAKRETKLDDGTISRLTKEQVEGFNQLGTLDERLAAMRATPEIGRQFMSTIEINETRSGIRALVLGGEAVQELDARASALVTPLAQATEEFQNLTTVIAEITQLTKARNEAEAASAVATIENRQRGFEGQILEIMDNALARVNLSGLDVLRGVEISAAMAAGEATGTPVAESAIAAMQAVQQQAGVRIKGRVVVPFGGGVSADDIAILQRAIQQIQQLEQQRLRAAANQQPAPVRVVVQPPAARPKEAPLPAVTTP